MERYALYILILFSGNSLYGQSVQKKTGGGKVIFGFIDTTQVKKRIIKPLNGGSITSNELSKATNIFAFYKTSKSNFNIDSIYYELEIWRPGLDGILLAGKGFDWNNKFIKNILWKSGSKLLVTITKIVLENGQTILYPPLENQRKISHKSDYGLENDKRIAYGSENFNSEWWIDELRKKEKERGIKLIEVHKYYCKTYSYGIIYKIKI